MKNKKKIIALLAVLAMSVQIFCPVFAKDADRIDLEPTKVLESREVDTKGTYENLEYEIADGTVIDTQEVIPDDALTFTASSVSAGAGDTVTITVDVTNNPGFSSLILSIGWNADVVELVSVDWFGLMAVVQPNVNLCKVAMTSSHNYTEDGTILIITFRINEDAVEGEYSDIVITPTNILNEDSEEVPAYGVNGRIDVVNVYTLSYYVDGELYEEIEYAYGSAIMPIAEPTREGYTFSGWSAIPETMPANDVRIDGTFAINTYTVTFVDHDGTVIDTQEVQHGDAAQAPADPTREGYTFIGWDKDFSCVTSDMTVTAQYEVPTSVYGNLKYVILDGEVVITGYVTAPTGELVIPETIEGYPVTTIGDNAFERCFSLTSVEMPKVQTIGSCAFHSCGYLTSVEMPKVQTIGSGAFFYCESLTSVEMPEVQTIGSQTFSDCYSLTSVEMPKVQTIGDDAFDYCGYLTSVEMPKVQTIGYGAFSWCPLTGSVEMPEVQTIGNEAFSGCESLTSVEMPNVQTIGVRAFYGCKSLTSVEMSEVQTIGGLAFSHCKSLTSIIISSYNENYSAEGGILYNKDKSTLIAYPSAANDIKIADNVQTIGSQAFIYCDLTSVEMSNVQTIGTEAFYGCYSLTSAYFYSDAPTSFGTNVFDACAEDFTIYYANGAQGWSTPTWNGYPAYPFNSAVIGDINGDEKINTADAVVILKAAAGMIQLDGIQSPAADVNHDGKVNTADAVVILKYAAGMITEF